MKASLPVLAANFAVEYSGLVFGRHIEISSVRMTTAYKDDCSKLQMPSRSSGSSIASQF
jgi:hypothetical protein